MISSKKGLNILKQKKKKKNGRKKAGIGKQGASSRLLLSEEQAHPGLPISAPSFLQAGSTM